MQDPVSGPLLLRGAELYESQLRPILQVIRSAVTKAPAVGDRTNEIESKINNTHPVGLCVSISELTVTAAPLKGSR
jgi:hypothetical protein